METFVLLIFFYVVNLFLWTIFHKLVAGLEHSTTLDFLKNSFKQPTYIIIWLLRSWNNKFLKPNLLSFPLALENSSTRLHGLATDTVQNRKTLKTVFKGRCLHMVQDQLHISLFFCVPAINSITVTTKRNILLNCRFTIESCWSMPEEACYEESPTINRNWCSTFLV